MEMIEKKTYETPEAEKMLFNYRDQVVAASNCTSYYRNEDVQGTENCNDGNHLLEKTHN